MNSIMSAVFEVLLVVPSALFREAGLLLVSVLFGVGMVILFRRTSNQEAIRRSKNRIKGLLLSLSLYPHEVGLAFRIYVRVAGATGRYLILILLPTVWAVVPFLLVAIQLEARFGRIPLLPGQAAVFSVLFEGGLTEDFRPNIFLVADPGLIVETPQPVRIPSEQELAWRIRAKEPGDFTLVVRVGERAYKKTVRVGEGVKTLSVERPGGGMLAQVLHPIERPLREAAGLRAIRIEYPKGAVSLLGWETHWMVFFIVVSMGAAVVARFPLGVEM